MWEIWVRSLGWEDPLEEGMATHTSILAWRISMDREAWWATVYGVMKSQTQLNTHTHTRAHMYMLHRAEIILAMSFLPSFFTWQYIISSYSLAVIIINIPSYPFII